MFVEIHKNLFLFLLVTIFHLSFVSICLSNIAVSVCLFDRVSICFCIYLSLFVFIYLILCIYMSYLLSIHLPTFFISFIHVCHFLCEKGSAKNKLQRLSGKNLTWVTAAFLLLEINTGGEYSQPTAPSPVFSFYDTQRKFQQFSFSSLPIHLSFYLSLWKKIISLFM